MYFNPNWVVTKNVDIGGSATNYPVGNYFPSNIAAVGFADYAGGDYHLTSQSFYKNLGTDGKDLGADIDSIVIASTYQCDVETGNKDLTPQQIECFLYPNPVDEALHIRVPNRESDIYEITIYDQLGRKVISKESGAGDEMINTSFLLSGIYFLQIRLRRHIVTRMFVVKH
ncbi:MAG: T9SS type A sorting domain-containing protein, partial [Saprospiraceae bacterium]